MVLDGSERVDEILSSAMLWDTMSGVSRRSWARNENSIAACIEYNKDKKDTDHITLPYIVDESIIKEQIKKFQG
jgi:urocanate hydratase